MISIVDTVLFEYCKTSLAFIFFFKRKPLVMHIVKGVLSVYSSQVYNVSSCQSQQASPAQ